MKKPCEKALWTAWILLLGLFHISCHETDAIRIGVVLPLSGERQAYGEASRRGLDLALDELGDESRIELVIADSRSDPRQAREALRQLYRDGAVAAIGGLTAEEAREMAAVAEEEERVLLSPSASLLQQDEDARYFFSLSASGYTAGTTLASFVAREYGVAGVVVIRESEIAAEGLEQGFRSALETHGGRIVASLEAPRLGGDPGSIVGIVMDHDPDAVLLAGYEPALSTYVRELRRRRFAGKILTPQSFALPGAWRRLGHDAAEVLLARTPFDPGSDDRRVKPFADAFRDRYGDLPDIYAAESYDALRVVAAVVAGRRAVPSNVRKGLLHDVREFPGVTGSLRFDERRQVSKMPRVYSVAMDLSLQDEQQRLREREEAERELQAKLDKILAELNASQ